MIIIQAHCHFILRHNIVTRGCQALFSKCMECNSSEMSDWLRNAICDLIILKEETMAHSCQTTWTSFQPPSPYSRWIVLLNWHCARGWPVQFYWKFNKVYNVTLWRFGVTVLNVEMHQLVPCVYCWRTCISVSNVINLLKPNDIYIYIYIYVVPQR